MYLDRLGKADAQCLTVSWLRVFRGVNAVHLPYGVEEEREPTAVQLEKCVARCGSASKIKSFVVDF